MIPREITDDSAQLINALLAAGAVVESARYDSQSFGNYEVWFRVSGVAFSLTRDRGQYMVHGPAREQLEAAGIWRAFDQQSELREPLLRWLRAIAA